MTREEIEKEAKNFALAHQNICVNKNTGVPHTEKTPCPVSEMRMIPIYNEIRHAYLCGALDALRQCIAIIRDNACEYINCEGKGLYPFDEESFIKENFDIEKKTTIAEILAKNETNG